MASLNFIGGEKGGVGKSVMARVLAQYFIDRQRPFVGYDTDRSHQTLRRFYSDYASESVVDDYASLDRIAEEMAEKPESSAVIDLAAQTFAPLAKWIQDSDLFSIFEEMEVSFLFWHVMDGSKDSVQLLNKLFDTYGDKPQYILVLNQGRSGDFSIFEESPEKKRAEELGAQTLCLPKLHEASMKKIDLHNTSFWAAVNHTSRDQNALGLLERQRVKVWLHRIYESLDDLPLIAGPAL